MMADFVVLTSLQHKLSREPRFVRSINRKLNSNYYKYNIYGYYLQRFIILCIYLVDSKL